MRDAPAVASPLEPPPSPGTAQPLVSVIMPAYRAAAFIDRAVASVQAQTYTRWELIIVDDASPDATADVVAGLAAGDSRIRLIRQAVNGGPSVARNAAIAAASGVWVAILDADDAYVPERLARMVAYAEAHELDMLADNILVYDLAAQAVSRTGFRDTAPARPWTLASHFEQNLPGRMFTYGWLKPLYRHDFLQRSGIAYRPEWRFGEDFLMYAELLLAGARARILSDGFYLYSLREGEISGQTSDQSQTRVDTGELIRGLEWFAATRDRWDADTRRCFDACLTDMRAYVQVRRLKEALWRRDWRQVAVLPLRHPAIWPFLWRALIRRVARQLLRHVTREGARG